MTKDEAMSKIRTIADQYTSFKIGKTGQELEDRFGIEYQEDYDKIHSVCRSEDKALVDRWEKDLIAHFQNDPIYAGKCDNDAVGGGEMADSNVYRIYVVGRH
jgi:hypothetical protein